MAEVDLSDARVFVDDRHPDDRWYVKPDQTVWFQPAGGDPRPAIHRVVDVLGSHWLREVPA